MIPSLHISGFKLFRNLDLPKLGGLNLFVGKNNTGKSCLLEAVELYSSSSPWDVLRVGSRREPDVAQRRKFDRFDPFELEESLRPLLNLFHREHGRIAHPQIRLSAGHPEADLELGCEPFLTEILDLDTRSTETGKYEPSSIQRRLTHLLQKGFVFRRGQVESKAPFFERFLQKELFSSEESEGWLHPDFAPVAFLPARGFSNSEAKALWDKASLTDKDELLLEWLRFIEPEIRDLRYINGPDASGNRPYLKIDGDRGRMPLSSLGDGLTRLFHIGLAMANASGGVLLIDEFENGLHWEVQKDLWKALFKAANRFGVQVFATSHSKDCIGGFLAAQSEVLQLSENYVYRLERNGDEVYALELPPENLDAALRNQVEVR